MDTIGEWLMEDCAQRVPVDADYAMLEGLVRGVWTITTSSKVTV